ncbi:hypothetical protein DPMN_109504 [Dreissena polymorpha]|uniref:Uncharacterized protein n=1 Tax=Dreissena polymorpha TaxID=45954 RepID=A0A9D4KAX4_DREPO|nr:hypothetical protein DPMN_109504 [Dreissena polymorpha]
MMMNKNDGRSLAKLSQKAYANDETIAGIETFDFQASIKALCRKRNDDWASDILGRIEHAITKAVTINLEHFRTFLKNTDRIVESMRRLPQHNFHEDNISILSTIKPFYEEPTTNEKDSNIILSESNPFHEGSRREHLNVKAASSKLEDGDARAVDPTKVMMSVDKKSARMLDEMNNGEIIKRMSCKFKKKNINKLAARFNKAFAGRFSCASKQDGDARAADQTEVMLSVNGYSLCIQKKAAIMQDIR